VNDRLIPVANADLIASRIPEAQFIKLAPASHIFMTDQPVAAHQSFLDFLSARSDNQK
jgi:pimeloyl-ACP methyl ester carboxylesterase